MQLRHGIHLGYCTNIHRGESWREVLANLEAHVLEVKARVSPRRAYGIGLRLGAEAAEALLRPGELANFRSWLAAHDCYVFTVNGFPYGRFHGTRVKEQVYLPDWTREERVRYTLALFECLAAILPDGMEGSVSTLPGSFKAFVQPGQEDAMVANLWRCVDALEALHRRTGKLLHLDLEPEPLCYLETSDEVIRFFGRMRAARPGNAGLSQYLRVNYDACHLAVEYEEPGAVLESLAAEGVGVGKMHFSSALKVHPSPAGRSLLARYTDDVYLHQTVVRGSEGSLRRFADLPDALGDAAAAEAAEWRIHYHVPLHAEPEEGLGTTRDHLLGLMDSLAAAPELCRHIEMETYTWEVLPPALKHQSVVDQLAAEYAWTLGQLVARGLA